MPILPLFSRVEKDAALNNPRRQLIVDFLGRNPGVRFRDLKRELGIPHGALVHHLRILRQQALIVFEREGRRLRIRLVEHRGPYRLDPEVVPLVSLVHAAPGLSIQDAATQLGWTRRKTAYWADVLVRTGTLEQAVDGTRRRLMPLRRDELVRLLPAT